MRLQGDQAFMEIWHWQAAWMTQNEWMSRNCLNRLLLCIKLFAKKITQRYWDRVCRDWWGEPLWKWYLTYFRSIPVWQDAKIKSSLNFQKLPKKWMQQEVSLMKKKLGYLFARIGNYFANRERGFSGQYLAPFGIFTR